MKFSKAAETDKGNIRKRNADKTKMVVSRQPIFVNLKSKYHEKHSANIKG